MEPGADRPVRTKYSERARRDCFGTCGPSSSASLRTAAAARQRPTWPKPAKLSNSPCCLSGVRIDTPDSLTRPTVLMQKIGGAPGEIRTPDPLVRSSKGQKNWKFWCLEVIDF
jgi:hypothetical protein